MVFLLGMNPSLTTTIPDIFRVFEDSPMPMAIMEGPEMRFVFVNKPAAELMRKPKEEILGHSYIKVLPHAGERFETLKKIFETGIAVSQEGRELIVGLDENNRPITEFVNFHSQVYRNGEGKIIGVASYGVVVTAEVEAKKELDAEAKRTVQILHNLSNGFFSVDRNWNLTYLNPAAESAIGGSLDELSGQNLWELHPELVGTEFHKAYHRSMNDRIATEVVNHYKEQDRWYHTLSYPLDDGIAVSFQEITVRKRAEEARQLSDERFHTLTESIPQIVWVANPDGNATYFNARMMEKTGTTLEQNLGPNWVEVVHPEDRARCLEAWMAAQENGHYDHEYRVRMADGQYRWYVARAVSIHDQAGKIRQWVGTSTDIHDQKKTQHELERAVNARDEFLSVASHELKTPLTVIKLQSELAKRILSKASNENGELKTYNSTNSAIERNVKRLTRIVDDILDSSRVTSGKLNLELDTLGIRELLDDSVERIKPLLEEAGCEVTYCPGEDGFIKADRFRIEQVLVNLLSNATRYGKHKPVIVSNYVRDGFAWISVKDHGTGISPDDQQRIFERYERATSTEGKSGLGLGLFISRSILDLHQGTIEVRSKLGEGAEFIIGIPLMKENSA